MKHEKSFTLIELLVVIAIIGLLASIVLVSLRSARGKASIAGGLQFSQNIFNALGDQAVGVWDFDDDINDRSGFNNNGVFSGSAQVYSSDTASGKGKSLFFDVTDINNKHSVDCGSNPSLDNLQNITASAWIKVNSGLNYRYIIDGKDRGGGGWHIRVYNWSSGRARVFSYVRCATTDAYRYSLYAIPADTWTNVVMTYNDTNKIVKFYINGVESNGASGTGVGARKTDALYNLHIGARNNGGTMDYFFGGNIDDIRVFSQALTLTEIQKLYVEGLKNHNLVSN